MVSGSRLLIGCAVSGVIVTVLGMAGAALLADGFTSPAGIPEGALLSVFLLHVGIRMLVGAAAFILYAAFIGNWPRAPGRAVGAIVLIWMLVYLPNLTLLSDYGLGSVPALVKLALWGFLEIGAALMLAWLAATAGRRK